MWWTALSRGPIMGRMVNTPCPNPPVVMSSPSRFERWRPLLAGAVGLVLLGFVAALLGDPALVRKMPDQSAGGRDWQKYPAVVEVDTTHDIYAVGDPHGDYERLV